MTLQLFVIMIYNDSDPSSTHPFERIYDSRYMAERAIEGLKATDPWDHDTTYEIRPVTLTTTVNELARATA